MRIKISSSGLWRDLRFGGRPAAVDTALLYTAAHRIDKHLFAKYTATHETVFPVPRSQRRTEDLTLTQRN